MAGLGALGSVAVGLSAALVARESNAFARTVAEREARAKADERAAEDLAERTSFGLLLTSWSDRYVYELRNADIIMIKGVADATPAATLRSELDVRSAALAMHDAPLLVEAVEAYVLSVPYHRPKGEPDPLPLLRKAWRSQIRSWIAQPSAWKDLDGTEAQLSATEWLMVAKARGYAAAEEDA